MSDVYALAITLNEVATGTIPFADCTKDNPACHTVLDAGYGFLELSTAVVAEQLRPTLPVPCPPSWARLMHACWHETPAERPDCGQLLQRLDELATEEGIERWSGPLQVRSYLQQCSAAHSSGMDEPAAAVHHDSEQSERRLPEPAELPPWHQDALKSGTWQPQLSAGAYEDAGMRGRDRMEDRHIVACPLAGTAGATLLAVFDGHRGAEAAEFVAANLPRHVRSAWAPQRTQEGVPCSSAQEVLQHALSQCEAELAVKESEKWRALQQLFGSAADSKRSFPGTAAVAVLLVGDVLAWANVGDCRAVLCSAGRAKQLTRDHVVSDAVEQARLQQQGVEIHTAADGSRRLGKARLRVSRSIGDFDAKESGTNGGMSAEPETGCMQLSDGAEFVLLASDGLWDVVSNDDAIALVHDTVKNPSMIAKRLVLEALARGSTDNVTVVVCFLQQAEALERVYTAGAQVRAPAATHHSSRAAVLQQLAVAPAQDEQVEQL